ncbi:MAG: hypothetical protein ACYDA4_05665 [Ignavibacteriaceae bacterium]
MFIKLLAQFGHFNYRYTIWEDIHNLYPKLNSFEKKKHPATYKENLNVSELKEYLNEELPNIEKLN